MAMIFGSRSKGLACSQCDGGMLRRVERRMGASNEDEQRRTDSTRGEGGTRDLGVIVGVTGLLRRGSRAAQGEMLGGRGDERR